MDDRIAALVRGLSTKAARIRALDAAGYSRADIARALGIRYQHVRNVLEVAPRAPLVAAEPEAPPYGGLLVEDGGRVRLPMALLERLGVTPGDRLAFRLDGDDVRLMARSSGLRWAQEMVASLGEDAGSEALIAERRAAASRDE
jgi:bifunctional DNA-binding transcriptional regulator/antitoxin component of YhaV-PrlF toxin-antitoxin module